MFKDNNIFKDTDDSISGDNNISRDKLIQVPPPSPTPSFPRGIHSCSVCTFSSTTPFGLEVHKGKARSSLRDSLSDEQICFVWHHLYLGWNGCLKASQNGIFQNYTHCQQLQVAFNYSLHQKGYEILERGVFMFSPSVVQLLIYPALNIRGLTKRSREV